MKLTTALKAALRGETAQSAAEIGRLIDALQVDQAALRSEYLQLSELMLTDDTVIARRQHITGQLEATALRLAALQKAREAAIVSEVEAELTSQIDVKIDQRQERARLMAELVVLDAQRARLASKIDALQYEVLQQPQFDVKRRLIDRGLKVDRGTPLEQTMYAAQSRLDSYYHSREAELPTFGEIPERKSS